MKQIPIATLGLLIVNSTLDAQMTQDRLQGLITEISNDAEVAGPVVQFTFNGVPIICISDTNADRMRLISPIANLDQLEDEHVYSAMAANFHTALDARYAISDGMMFSLFIHPMSPLSDDELRSAISQVAETHMTFGTSYSSGELVFPGGSRSEKNEEEEDEDRIEI